jgi:hypothetical protein
MSNKIKTRKAILLLAFIAVALCASARSVATAQFTITTPDSSWAVEDNSDNMRSVGSYVSLARYEDSRGKVLELAQVYSIDAVFDAGYFINRQAIQRHDLFCRAGKDFSTVTDTVFAGKKSKRVNFTKASGGYTYDCSAICFNAGYSTFFVIRANRRDVTPTVDGIISAIHIADTTTLSNSASYVKAMTEILKRHPIALGNNEYLKKIVMPDSANVTLTVTIPYLNSDNVKIDVFAQSKHDSFVKGLPDGVKSNLLNRAFVAEHKTLHFIYVDTSGHDIARMIVKPADYADIKL